MGCSVRLIGQFRIHAGDGRDITPRSRKACCLLAYLLLNTPARETRGKLATLFWSDRDDEHARASLRQTLKELRGVLDGHGFPLVIDKQAVQIDRSLLAVDIDEIDSDLRAGDAAGANRHLTSVDPTLAADLMDSDPLFESWLTVRRGAWAEEMVSGLVRLMSRPETAQDDRNGLARVVLQLDPYCEPAVSVQLEGLAAHSGVQAALAYYETYRKRLDEEYEVEPSEELEAQVAALRNRAQSTAAARAATPGRSGGLGLPTIAVAERARMAPPLSHDHVLFAFVAELGATLGRFRDWVVFQTNPVLVPDIERAPDWVEHLVEQEAEFGILVGFSPAAPHRALQVAVHHCPSGQVVFRRDYTISPNDWPGAFNTISARIASQLQLAISHARLPRPPEPSPERRSAYDLWLEGQKLANLWRVETETAAIERYEAAIRLAPTLACAHAGLAAIYNSRWIVLPGWADAGTDNARALELAQHAMRLDPLDHRAQVNLGWTHLLARRWDPAAVHFRLAHDLNPNNPQTLIAHGLANAFMGRPRQALELAARAVELAPVREDYVDGYRASIAFLAGDYEACVAAVEAAPQIFPDIQGWRAAALMMLDRKMPARAAIERFLDDMRQDWAGAKPVTPRMIVDWFKTIFPLRRPADRRRLATAIEAAYQAAGERGNGGGPPPPSHLHRVMM